MQEKQADIYANAIAENSIMYLINKSWIQRKNKLSRN